MRDAKELKRKVGLKVGQRAKDGWQIFEFFAARPAKRALFYAPVSVFRIDIESSQILRVQSQPFLAYYRGVLFGDDDRNTQWAQRMVALQFVVLALGLFHQTVCHGIAMRYRGGCI